MGIDTPVGPLLRERRQFGVPGQRAHAKVGPEVVVQSQDVLLEDGRRVDFRVRVRQFGGGGTGA
jgi:hypothetical protein